MKMNWKKISLIILGCLMALLIVKDLLIQTAIGTIGSAVLGAPVHVGGFGWNILTQKIRIRDLSVEHPAGFERGKLIDIPEIAVDYDLPSLLKGKFYFPFINVNLKEMMIIKNKEGKLNVDALKVSQNKEDGKKAESKSSDIVLTIDLMKLNIGRTVYKDYSRGEKPVLEVFNVGLKDKTFKNIKSTQQLATIILVQGMGPAAIKGAAIYGAAAILGVAFLPAGAVAILIGQDSDHQEYTQSFEKVYRTSLNLFKEIGEIVSEDQSNGLIKGRIDGVDVTVKIQKAEGKIHLTATGRKMMLPKHEIASGFVYQLTKRLN